jgi:hypothetical protein
MRLRTRLHHKAIREADLLRVRLRHERTLRLQTDSAGPVALVVSLNEFIYQLKTEAMIAKAFELQGLTPVFAVPTGAATARRYLGAFGVKRFIELADYVDDALEAEARREAAALADGITAVADLARFSYRGAAIGRYAVSTVSRILHEGSVDLREPEARRLLGETLLIAIRSTLASEAILDDLQPELVLFNERNYAAEAPLSDLALARGLNVVQFVAGFQDDSLVFKRYTAETRRLHPRSLSDASWERVKVMAWTPERDDALEEEFARRYDGSQLLQRRNQEWTRPWTADEIRRELVLDPSKRTAVLFSHVLWDANMFYGEDLFDDQEEWLVESVRAACANDRVNWIVKLHPANVWKRKRDGIAGEELGDLIAIRRRIGTLPRHVKLLLPESPIATRSLFEVVDCGITIRGSIGVELPCFGVPVLTAGTGFYSGRGFTVDSATPGEYLGRLARIEEIAPLSPGQIELARRHAYALLCLRQTPFTSFRSTISGKGGPLDQNLEVTLGSREELLAAEDLRRLGDWAVNSRDLDYLQEL